MTKCQELNQVFKGIEPLASQMFVILVILVIDALCYQYIMNIILALFCCFFSGINIVILFQQTNQSNLGNVRKNGATARSTPSSHLKKKRGEKEREEER